MTEIAGARPSSRPPSWRWWISGLFLLATAINYMDRLSLASASVRVTREFGLTDAQYGNIELGFGWAFAVGAIGFGILADWLNIYLLYPAVLVGWSLMGMATGWTHDFSGLLICRILLGFFEAGQWPCAMKASFALLDEKDRPLGNNMMQSGCAIGAVIMPQIVKLMMTGQSGSWRAPFVAVGAAGFLWVGAWFIFLRPRDLEAPVTESMHERSSLFKILFSKRFWALAILTIGPNTVWHVNRVWLMKFLQTGRGYGEKGALDFITLYYITANIGCFAGAFVSYWLIRRRGSSLHLAQRKVYAGACVLTSLSVFIPWLGKGWPLLVTLLVIGASALALFPCYYSHVQELSAAYIGRLTGLLGMWVWIVTSPVHSLIGMLVDRSGSYDMSLVIAGLAPWIGVISMGLLWRTSPSANVELPCAEVAP